MNTTESTRYACKLCRTVLFTSEALLTHTPEQHHIATRRKLKDLKSYGANTQMHTDCSSLFLAEPPLWVSENDMAEGKLHCPQLKCQTRLGSFDWAGEQCSCGTWVTPSIKIPKSRVDFIYQQPVIMMSSTLDNEVTPKDEISENIE